MRRLLRVFVLSSSRVSTIVRAPTFTIGRLGRGTHDMSRHVRSDASTRRRMSSAIPRHDVVASEPVIMMAHYGKVGSTGLWNAVVDAFSRGDSSRQHALATDVRDLQNARDELRHTRDRTLLCETRSIDHPIVAAIRDTTQRRRFKIIALYRDPVERNMSSFFQHWSNSVDTARHSSVAATDVDNNAGAKCLRLREEALRSLTFQGLARRFEASPAYAFDASVWFNRLGRALDVDFSVDVPRVDRAASYRVYRSHSLPVDVMLVNCDEIESSLPAIEDFLALKRHALTHVYEPCPTNAATPWYGPLYDAFKERYRYPMHIAKRLYDTPFFRSVLQWTAASSLLPDSGPSRTRSNSAELTVATASATPTTRRDSSTKRRYSSSSAPFVTPTRSSRDHSVSHRRASVPSSATTSPRALKKHPGRSPTSQPSRRMARLSSSSSSSSRKSRRGHTPLIAKELAERMCCTS